ncbi:glycosyltransferase family 117 protein [Robertkochia sediminum]|uniref:glycosyltransferase family 117 protein n=1 Tax=Robertkochia sediminum TaxID=2785326 RepID=UPI00193230D2|nr:DUF2723 domain-containing protein [Robertkochia sediminum]MBL7473910.1 DUF2723 domain-containing protein [Robertkochia sediminum]
MTAQQFKKWDTILGWIVFAIALTVYHLTVEPTSSFWDAGEYIATSSKLQVGHPPGAPLFQMIGAFFGNFSFSPETIAVTVNHMSVFSSAFTILFMFWTITNLTRKLALMHGEMTAPKYVAVLGSGLTGALAFTFTDSFWFNAVEAEVYAMATFLMALMFYLGLKWSDEMHTPRANRWLVLLALITGLSFGVHFMALLTIPAIGMIYYFRNFKEHNAKGFILANLISITILLFIFKLLLPNVLRFFGYLEVFFVNSIGLPFNSGTIIAAILIIVLFWYLINYTKQKKYPMLNSIVLSIMFILIGFSTWLMIPIRANAGTVINENSPTDARQLLAYYNMEQYPETHLFFGPMFTDAFAGQDPADPYKDEKPKYERDYKAGKYVIVNDFKYAIPNAHGDHVGFLPRMWSSSHAANYMKITGPVNVRVKREYRSDQQLTSAVAKLKQDLNTGELDTEDYVRFIRQFDQFIEVEKPSFGQNMKYLFDFQMGYMYWRYFLWNFVGRQDDIQGKLDNHGNWLSGIKFADEWRLGPQDNLPSDVLNNKGRNTYYFLPLILGLIGFLFLLKTSKQKFWVLFVLFMFTGLALKVYLNERPFEPRERDYALVGSFYVFSIWIGMGVYAIFEEFKKFLAPKILAPAVTAICLLAVPTVLATENWDDHDRSNRYTAQSIAKSYLESIQEDAGAMLFTIGDNDTFSLWYAQEVEGYRTDVRTINTSLFATDWYIDQMKKAAYESAPIPSQLEHSQYAYGVRDAVYLQQLTEERWDIKKFMDWIANDDYTMDMILKRRGIDPEAYPESYRNLHFYPTNKIRVPVNKENVLKSGLVKPEDAHLIVDYIDIDIPGEALPKNRILMLDILANNNWERPIYFTGGSFDSAEYMWMKDYLQLDGLVYKLVPIKTAIDPNNPYEMGRIDEDLMYDIVMDWKWGNSESTEIYHDPETRKNSISFRGNLARLTEKLINEGKEEKAKDILNLAMEKMPFGYFGYYVFLEPFVNGYYQVGETTKARELFEKVATKYQEHLEYYGSMNQEDQMNYTQDIINNMERYRSLLDIVARNDVEDYALEQAKAFNDYLPMFAIYRQAQRSQIYDREQLPDVLEEESATEDPSETIPAADSQEVEIEN